MASLLGRILASFQATIPVSSLNDLDSEFNQYVGAAGVFNGGTTAKKLLVKSSDASDPPLELDQIGAGPLAEWKQNGTLKVSIENSGQIDSTVATGTAPIDVDSTTVCPNLNADLVDGIEGANIAKLDTHKTAFSVSWFYPVLPGAVETVESVGRWIVPTGQDITITEIWAVWAGGSDSGASNIFTIKRRNSSGVLQADVGTIDINTPGQDALVANNVTDVPLSSADFIYPLFTTRNTASEQLVTITVVGTQKFTT